MCMEDGLNVCKGSKALLQTIKMCTETCTPFMLLAVTELIGWYILHVHSDNYSGMPPNHQWLPGLHKHQVTIKGQAASN